MNRIKWYFQILLFKLTHNTRYEELAYTFGRKQLSEMISDPNDHTLTIAEKIGIIKYAKRKYGIDMYVEH